MGCIFIGAVPSQKSIQACRSLHVIAVLPWCPGHYSTGHLVLGVPLVTSADGPEEESQITQSSGYLGEVKQGLLPIDLSPQKADLPSPKRGAPDIHS